MRKVFWWSAVLYGAVLLVLAWTLPADGVVLHSGPDGPDRYGSKAELLGVTAAVGAGTALLFGALAELFMARVDLTSPLVNLPYKTWWTRTPERTATARRMLTDDLYGVGAGTLVFLALALGAVQYLAEWVTAALVGVFVVAVLGWCVHGVTRRYRPRPGAEPDG
ncbi:hypothetical protein [Streptomyces sp. Da 82-17]|uniref:hypothetical protein n=1 Tax=Streptomyces sp. Da 82-17 TaxID=3377116 RepID=UPI0038D454D5